MAYFGKRGTMNLVYQSDGAGGNFIYPIIFEGLDLNAVAGRPRPDEIPVMDRGNLNPYAHHVQGPDVPIIQPVALTFSCMIDNTFGRTNLLLALCNAPRTSPWQINGTNLSNVNGTTMVINGAGSLVSTPLPYDTQQDRITVEVLFRGDPHVTPGSDDYGHRFNEVWFQPGAIRLVEAPDSYKFNVTGSIYGPISQITALGTGTNLLIYVAN
jgi:hypothetical protein